MRSLQIPHFATGQRQVEVNLGTLSEDGSLEVGPSLSSSRFEPSIIPYLCLLAVPLLAERPPSGPLLLPA